MNRLLTFQRIILGVFLIVVGAGLTATLLGAVLGIPLMLFGTWIMLQKVSDE